MGETESLAMCGIFGAVFSKTEGVAVDRALASIHHRGPDDTGVHRVDDAVFGFKRLAILDLTAAGAQPMKSADGNVVIVFNGEIYNHHELRAELERKGHVFRSRSDTEAILEGYRAWGDGVIERIDGMFALGIYDVPKRRLLLARDRAGKKPLFYTLVGRELRFASEIKALVASGIPADVDTDGLHMVLALGYVPSPGTMLRDVRQLPPASTLVVEEGIVPVERRYWHAPFAGVPVSDPVPTASEKVRTLLDAAVKRRLEADVPLGAFLSGGIDSTIIVGLMARHMGQKVKTFSIGFAGDARFDETHYARIAAKAFGTEHTEFTLEPTSFELVERLVEAHDGPFGDSSAIPTSVVSMLTRKHVTVALTGDGGDELFCGYSRFLAAEAAERVPVAFRRAGRELARAIPSANSERTLRARARRFLTKAGLPLADRLVAWSSYFTFDLEALIQPDVYSREAAEAPLAWNRRIVDATSGAGTLSRVLDHNFEGYLPYDLLIKADRSSMHHSLELRSPFLDTALIEYASRLPDSYRRRGTNMKWLLKHAFRELLPKEILTRGKMGFGVPLGAWFRGELRPYLRDRFAPGALLYGYVQRPFVEKLLTEHEQGRFDHGHRIWLLLTLEVWLEQLAKARG